MPSKPANRYTILDDGTFAARQSQSGAAVLYDLDTEDVAAADGPWPITIRHYPLGLDSIGGLVSYAHTDTPADIHPASVRETTLPQSELDAAFAESGIPMLVDGELHLTDDLSVEQFR